MSRSITTRSTNPKIMDDNIKILDDAIGALDAPEASDVSYDNTDSGLTADDVQSAINELVADIETVDTKNTYQPGETITIDFAYAMGISNAGGNQLSVMLYLPKEVSGVIANISGTNINLLWIRGGTATSPEVDKINLHRPNIAEIIINGTFDSAKMYTASITGSFTLPSA